MKNEKPYDEIIVQEIGGSLMIVIPKKHALFLELNKGNKVQIDAEKGKYGKYMSLWKKKND